MVGKLHTARAKIGATHTAETVQRSVETGLLGEGRAVRPRHPTGVAQPGRSIKLGHAGGAKAGELGRVGRQALDGRAAARAVHERRKDALRTGVRVGAEGGGGEAGQLALR